MFWCQFNFSGQLHVEPVDVWLADDGRFVNYMALQRVLFDESDWIFIDGFLLNIAPTKDDHPQIAGLLAAPKIFSDLTITPVKTFKGEVPTGPTEFLKAD